MTTLVRIHRKGQMTLPSRLRSAIGVNEGDLVEANVLRGKIVLTPKVLVDRSKFPTADDEYTPAQRRVIDARLAEAMKSPSYGPFTALQAERFLRTRLKPVARKSKKAK